MPPRRFQLSVVESSPYFVYVQVFANLRAMRNAMRRDGADARNAFAAFVGEASGLRVGVVYLHERPQTGWDAIHELTHAAVHFVRLRFGPTPRPASRPAAEELLCETVEHLVAGYVLHFKPQQ